MELVKVAGTAINIHHTILVKNSFPLPLTSALTIAPSISATLRLIKVLKTKKKLWLSNNLVSLDFHPGTTILSSRNNDLKNSRFNSTFFLGVSSLPLDVVPRRAARWLASRAEAAFCSETAWRMRLARATKRVIQMAREMRVRLETYRLVRREMRPRMVRSRGNASFDCEAMTVVSWVMLVEDADADEIENDVTRSSALTACTS